MVSPILHVAVIGFHHKRGGQAEYFYPPLADNGELPVPWQNLPSLALPDGAHNVDHDVIYFLLPSLEDPNRSVFGISCYRQMAAKDLLNKSTDVTRSTVQKSVCVLSEIPLFGVLTAKLQLITEVYFNERDFAKVEVLSQMYANLCEMFPDENVDEQAAVMDISVQSLVTTFKHRVLVLFKLLLLEKKLMHAELFFRLRNVVFYISPVFQLSRMMVALVSLYPRLVEDGLFHAAAYTKSSQSCTDEEKRADEGDIVLEMGKDVLEGETLTHESDNAEKKTHHSGTVECAKEMELLTLAEDLGEEQLPSIAAGSISNSQQRGILDDTDSYGFPLGIFTKGSLFHPYLSISYLDMIRSDSTRAYCIGATNALFVQRRDSLDAIVTVDESGDGNIEIVNAELRRALTLTAADLRFIDFVIKEVEANAKSPSWEGSDDWVRLQMRAYLLSLIATVRADLKDALNDFSEAYIEEWVLSNNYRVWSSGDYPDLSSAVPGHPFAGGLGLSDVLLRVEHSVAGTESGRRVASAVVSTGKYFTDTGSKVKTSIASWLKGNMRSTE